MKMEILKFENAPRPVRKKSSSSKIVLGFASIAAVAMLGSTLAASITLNDDTDVEFGQGVAQTTACDSDGITVTPISTFNNASNIFELTSVQLTGVNDSACAGKLFTLKGYSNSGDTPVLTFAFTYDSPTGDGVSDVGGAVSITTTTAVFTPTSPIDISPDPSDERDFEIDLKKLTLETSNDPTPTTPTP